MAVMHRLLRARRERPCSHSAAEKRDELAPFHCPIPPVLSTERIAHLSYGRRLLRCDISVGPMTALGQKRRGPSARADTACPLCPESGQIADSPGMSA